MQSANEPANAASAPAQRGPQESLTRALDIARRYGETNAVETAEALLAANFKAGTVVVVGEIKRGKSSLVNALVGRRDLLPVDVLTSTSAPIRITVAGTDDAPTDPVVEILRGGGHERIRGDELRDYVTIDGIKGSGAGTDDDELATAAAITLAFPELEGITVVDTPGVGGLDEHAVHAAFSEAHRAGVLLMVCDASTPITKPEMDILERARREVGAVVVAVTKTDKNIRRWKSIVDDDRRLIREYLGTEVPVVGVSSLRALDAADVAETDAERAAEIAARSGIVDLRAQLRGLLASPETLGLRSAIESAVSTLSGIQQRNSRDIQLNAEPTQGVEELEEEQKKLEHLKEHASEWEQLLSRDIQLMRNRISDELDNDVENLRNAWTQRINTEGMRVLRSKPQVFTSQIEAELTELIGRTLDKQLDGLRVHAQQLFPDRPEAVQAVLGAAVESISPTNVQGREVEKKTKDLVDPSMVTMGALGAGMLSFMIPFAPLAGVVWVGVNMGFKALRNGKMHLIQWLREITQTTRMSVARMLDTMIAAARTEMVLRYRAHLRQRQKEVQEHIATARAAAQESEKSRKEKIVRLDKNTAIIAATIDELNAHLGALQSGVGVDKQEGAR